MRYKKQPKKTNFAISVFKIIYSTFDNADSIYKAWQCKGKKISMLTCHNEFMVLQDIISTEGNDPEHTTHLESLLVTCFSSRMGVHAGNQWLGLGGSNCGYNQPLSLLPDPLLSRSELLRPHRGSETGSFSSSAWASTPSKHKLEHATVTADLPSAQKITKIRHTAFFPSRTNCRHKLCEISISFVSQHTTGKH